MIVAARGAFGPIVERAQRKLGLSPDMDFGAKTESAVRLWQEGNGRPISGELPEADWVALTGESLPSMFEKSLGVTMRMESHSWSNPKGNFDGAKITAGIIGFQLKSGSLQEVLRAAGFNPERLTLAEYPVELPPDIKAWIETALESPAGRAAQLAVARDMYWAPSQRSADLCGFTTPAYRSLCFDVHVQCPPVTRQEARLIGHILDENMRARALVEIKAVGKWAANVRARKMIFIDGDGTANDKYIDLRSFGLK